MNYFEYKIYGIVLLTIVSLLAISAIWLCGVLLKEAQDIKAASKNVQSAFTLLDVEVTKKLKNNNAIHFYDLMRIVEMVTRRMPMVKITVDKKFERNQVKISIEKGDVKASYTFLATIVEAPYHNQGKQPDPVKE
ncbi:hypothetical protein OBP_024 [Pseudomonas phage OBP]|uniref:hypothetical protein n=1 Tax=Pseudomonas phage OBP TaxID=1124849 RepID=UPI000240D615|nr:hypothetical protein OBP_024 [Pseudomonas phage OBP]AEV89461.1 hypothetical protein OBP_024 [Pseudomonas phage OBP]